MSFFNSKQPSVRIERVDKIEVTLPFTPHYEELIHFYLKHLSISEPKLQFPSRIPTATPPERDRKVNWAKWIDLIGKIISIVSGVAMIVFITLLYAGVLTIGSITINHLVNLVSFTFLSGIISIGGVKMFSINASLRQAQQQIKNVLTPNEGCPYVAAIDDEAKKKYNIKSPFEIGNKDFCDRCPLVDHNGRTICKVSPLYRH
jgi:hypothetical protein